jgi:alpha-tubulin suppressor-like RCC1 family protein
MGVAVFSRGVARFLTVVLFVVAPGLMVLPPAVAADPVVEDVVSFADVPSSSMFHKEISWLASEGISTGWDVGRGVRQYRPLDSIARDAMAAFLYRKAGSPAYAPPVPSPFADVAPGAAFYKEITWLASKGISTGWDLGSGKREYRPSSPIARDAMAAFLFRFAQPPLFTPPVQSPFVDVAAGGAFYREITWLASSGISTGWDVGGGLRQYRPLNGIARDAMAAFLYRYASDKVPADPLAPAAGTVTVAPDVEILDAAQLDTAQVSPGVITLPSDKALEIRPNDVLVAGVTVGTPEGLLARVVQVTRDPGGNTVVKTKPATLTEAIVSTSGLIEVSGTPEWSTFTPEPDVTVTPEAAGAGTGPQMPLPEAQVEGEVFSKSFSVKKTIKAEIGTDELHGSGSISFDSSIKAAAKAKMTLEAGFLQLKEASLVLTPSFTATHSITVAGSLEGKASAKLGVLKAVYVHPGPVPVVVTAEAEVALNLTATGTAEISYSTSQTVAADYGFKYREGSFNLVNTKPRATGLQNDVRATASLTATLSLDFDATIKLYGMAGITFGAGPYVSATIAVTTTDGTRTWSCPIVHGYEARLGVVAGIEVMGFTIGEWSDVNTATWKLAEYNPCEGTPVVSPTGLAITTPALPGGAAGQPYLTTVTASGGSSPYTWTVASGRLPDGLRLDAGTGQIAGTPTAPGTTNVTLKVTDGKAAMATRPFAITVRASDTDPTLPMIVTGVWTTYALREDGTVWAWGKNDFGQLGSTQVTGSPVPLQIPGLTNVRSIEAGSYSAFAVKTDGTVWAWGDNNYGQLGNGTKTKTSNPTQVIGLTGVEEVISLGVTTVALKSDGTVWAWGDGSTGVLGNGSNQSSLVPVQARGLSEVRSVTTGGSSIFALKSDGTVWSWGYNFRGQLGNGTTADSSLPGQIPNLTGVAEVSAAGAATFALKSDGSVWGWGGNYLGQLGNGTSVDAPLPMQISGLAGVRYLSAGYTSFVVKADGTVWAWGSGSNGALGNGTTTGSAVPVRTSDLTGLTKIVEHNGSVYGLEQDGTVWVWGANQSGQLGIGTLSDISRPVQVSAMKGTQSITPGTYAAFAVKADGSIWAWGDNVSGHLGDGTYSSSSSPVRSSLPAAF